MLDEASTSKPLIMIVDDEKSNLLAMSSTLSEQFDIITCESGEKAIEQLSGLKDELELKAVLCDQRMPGLTGVVVLQKFKQISPDTIRLLFTGYSDMRAIVDSINKAQIFEFLKKPLYPEELIMAVNRAVNYYDLQKRVKKTDQLREEVLATISHEFLTPMNGICGALDLIAKQKLDKELAQNIEAIDLSAQHMMGLIRSVIDFTQFQSGLSRVSLAPVNINTSLNILAKKYLPIAAAKGLTFKFTPSDFVGQCLVDEEKVLQLVDNLIDNAIKFTKAGEVALIAAVKQQDVGEASKGILTIAVEDSGLGIDAVMQDEIFHPLKQADGSFSRRFGGLGIGLSLVKLLVDAMQGDIQVESTIDSGSRFTLTLPVEVDLSPLEADKESSSNELARLSHGHKTKILVVEDNKVNQLIIMRMLEQEGCRVHACAQGLEAVEWCENNKVDLIFMDCQMPMLDGLGATEQIRRGKGVNAGTPIIAVTANVSPNDREHCFDVGMNGFLAKPISRQEIVDTLSSYAQQE